MSSVRYEVAERIATITIDRPAVKNALGPEEWRELRGRIDAADADADVRVLVITGAGGTFSAGGDLKTMPERLAEPRDVRAANLVVQAQIVPRLRELGKPVIAMIDGACVGAGLSLALACDLRIAGRSARMTTAFAKVGLSGDYGGTWFLTQLVGTAKARELYFLSEILDAERIEALGLANRVVADEELIAETMALARKLASGRAWRCAI